MKMYEFRLKFHWNWFPKGPINNIPALVQIMAWRRPGDKPLSDPMMIILLAHISVTQPHWVKATWIAHERKYTCKNLWTLLFLLLFIYICIYKHAYILITFLDTYIPYFSIHLIFISEILHRRIRDTFYDMAYMCTYPVGLHGLHGR